MLASGCPRPLYRDPQACGDFLERSIALVAPEGVGLGVVGDEDVDAAVDVEIGGEDAHASALAGNARLGGDVGELAVAFVAIEHIGLAGSRRQRVFGRPAAVVAVERASPGRT